MRIFASVMVVAVVAPGVLGLQSEGCGEEPPPAPTLVLSEYVEGASWDKAVEVYNATDDTLDLGGYALWIAYNGGPWPGTKIPLKGALPPGATFVVAHPQASQTVLGLADLLTGDLAFNGDDAVGLAEGDLLLDALGAAGADPGDAFPVGTVATGTLDHRLIRDLAVLHGETDWATAQASWLVYAASPATTLGVHPHGGEEAACQTSSACLPGLSCMGVPNPYYGGTGPGCCTDLSAAPGQGEMCASDEDCGGDLLCIAEQCSPSWMAGSFDSAPAAPIPDGGALTDAIVASCLASVPVTASLDLHITHPRPEDLRITIVDPGHNVESVIYDGAPVDGDELELVGAPVGHSGDDAVNGPWTLTVTDRVSGEVGVLDRWTLHLTSRWD